MIRGQGVEALGIVVGSLYDLGLRASDCGCKLEGLAFACSVARAAFILNSCVITNPAIIFLHKHNSGNESQLQLNIAEH